MNKEQAYQAMLSGFRVRNEYYGQEEYLFINDEGKIEAEDGCVFGTKYDKAWAIYQDPENSYEWEIVPHKLSATFADPYVMHARDHYDDPLMPRATKKQLAERAAIPVKPSTPMDRNLPCSCGSGFKTKKCCNK